MTDTRPADGDGVTVWRVTTPNGQSCHFGDYATARAWARGSDVVESVRLRPSPDLRVASPPEGDEATRLAGICRVIADTLRHGGKTLLADDLYRAADHIEGVRLAIPMLVRERAAERQRADAAERERDALAREMLTPDVYQRLVDWLACDPIPSAMVAFTAGIERQIAYALEHDVLPAIKSARIQRDAAEQRARELTEAIEAAVGEHLGAHVLMSGPEYYLRNGGPKFIATLRGLGRLIDDEFRAADAAGGERG